MDKLPTASSDCHHHVVGTAVFTWNELKKLAQTCVLSSCISVNQKVHWKFRISRYENRNKKSMITSSPFLITSTVKPDWVIIYILNYLTRARTKIGLLSRAALLPTGAPCSYCGSFHTSLRLQSSLNKSRFCHAQTLLALCKMASSFLVKSEREIIRRGERTPCIASF